MSAGKHIERLKAKVFHIEPESVLFAYDSMILSTSLTSMCPVE